MNASKPLLLAALAVAALLQTSFLPQQTFASSDGELCTGTVTAVLTGDRLRVDCLDRAVKVAHIDAPIIAHDSAECLTQPYAQAAKGYGEAVLLGREVTLRRYHPADGSSAGDASGVTEAVAEVEVKGQNYAKLIVSAGLAQAKPSSSEALQRVQDYARYEPRNNEGALWSAPEICHMPPWVWRNDIPQEKRCFYQTLFTEFGCPL